MSFAAGASPGRNPVRRQSSKAALVALIWAVLPFAAVSLPAQSASTVERLVTETLGFSTDDVRALDGGSAVSSSLDTPVREELANVGVVYVDARPEQVIERFRDIERFERGPGIPQIGRFSSPPRLEDLHALTLPEADRAGFDRLHRQP